MPAAETLARDALLEQRPQFLAAERPAAEGTSDAATTKDRSPPDPLGQLLHREWMDPANTT